MSSFSFFQWRFVVLLVGVFLGSARAAEYPDPGQCTGDCIYVQDFSIIRSDNGTYYRFAGHHGIEVATAPTLTGPWKNSSQPAFPRWQTEQKSLVPKLQDMWAPDVRKLGDTYYMFFTAENFGTAMYGYGNLASAKYGVTMVATSKTLEPGSWKIQGSLDIPINGPRYTRFDTSILVEGNDIFMSFGSYSWGLYGISLQSPPLKLAEDKKVTELVADEWIPGKSNNHNRTEGSYLYKHDDFYYIFYASGDCCAGIRDVAGSEYKIEYCRAKTVKGPYYRRDGGSCLDGNGGTLLLPSHGKGVYAPGSPSIIDDPTHGTVLLYQYMDPRIGLAMPHIIMGWNPLAFEDGWPVLQDSLKPTTPPAPSQIPHPYKPLSSKPHSDAPQTTEKSVKQPLPTKYPSQGLSSAKPPSAKPSHMTPSSKYPDSTKASTIEHSSAKPTSEKKPCSTKIYSTDSSSLRPSIAVPTSKKPSPPKPYPAEASSAEASTKKPCSKKPSPTEHPSAKPASVKPSSAESSATSSTSIKPSTVEAHPTGPHPTPLHPTGVQRPEPYGASVHHEEPQSSGIPQPAPQPPQYPDHEAEPVASKPKSCPRRRRYKA
ncbi:hypothetical protein FH972_025123 [Carpinus fangiana]|uniref:Endo-1,5-alpha-L-arabinanase A n=1 Tax=Carpinus fangiana TaxID=176857 RepID=A0A5N6L040_9ROSI|nr:hypothetical protein FH972_025123 [Carpinus fangiana]